jgi:hypothetical protein
LQRFFIYSLLSFAFTVSISLQDQIDLATHQANNKSLLWSRDLGHRPILCYLLIWEIRGIEWAKSNFFGTIGMLLWLTFASDGVGEAKCEYKGQCCVEADVALFYLSQVTTIR